MIKTNPPSFFLICFALQNKIKILLLLLMFVNPVYCNTKMLFYRIPFHIQTYNPITKKEIKKLAAENGMQELSPLNLNETLSILNSNKNKCYLFDDKNIRIYLVKNSHEYFIDSQGVLVSIGVKYKCSKNKIDEDVITKLLLEANKDMWKDDDE